MKNLIPLFAIILCCSLAHPAHARKKDRHAAKENAVLAMAEPDMMATPSRPHPIVAPIEEAYRHHVNKNEHRYGIDVSRYQGKIDWQTVKTDKNVGYVYLKATEGASLVDVTYRYNLDEARKAGLKVGAYHFFRKNGNGTLQAANFLDAVAGKMLDLPLAIDVEDWGNEDAESEAVVRTNLQEMVTALQNRGCRVMIYTNKDGHRSYIRDQFSHLDLWLCTFKHPRKVSGYDWTMLQYSHWGNVAGVDGEVDLNVFNGDSLQWEAWLRHR